MLNWSRPLHIRTYELLAKNPAFSPDNAMPNSTKAAGERRAFGFGFSKRLKGLNSVLGIAPLEDGVGEGCGGSMVGGRIV